MILWSKGLGKLVLRMSLAERSSTGDRDGKLTIDGTMGPPTHWDYAVNMSEADVLDFVELLKKPSSVRFVTEANAPGRMVRTAMVSGIVFAWNTARCFLGMAPRSAPEADAAAKAAVGKKAAKAADRAPGTNRS